MASAANAAGVTVRRRCYDDLPHAFAACREIAGRARGLHEERA